MSKNNASTSKSTSTSSSGTAQKKSELNELTEDLNSTKPEIKKEALKKVIANMTVGKDVAPLFQSVIKCIEVNDIEIKKLVYLYIINNSRTRPDDAIMVISLFRKDIQNKASPLLRALAARTMGCIRVKKLNDYLIDPLREAMADEDPYVKKTAVLCIPKVYEISPELIEQNGIIETLNKMLDKEGNAYVIANILCALTELSAFKNKNVLNVNYSNVQKLALALNECGEWSQIYILESLATYVPNDIKEAEDLIDRVIPRLGHINPAVVLTAIKVIMKYMEYLTNDEQIRALCKKISPPLASLLARPPEIQYVALKNMKIILEKQPHILEKDIRAFFIKFNDPYYIKLEKLEIITKLCDNRNFDVVIPELAEYANDVDQEFSRKSLKALAKICIKVDKAAEKCIEIIKKILSECKKALHIAHECAIVLQIVLRKFPEKFEYDTIMKEFCEFLHDMDEGEAKASLIWIIGEYAEKIDNSEQIIAKAAENFLTEPACVQLQLLTATVKLYLKKPDEAEQLVQDVLSLSSEQNEIPDVRDRGYIYWRLLSSDPEKTKKIVLSDRPVLAEDVVSFEPTLLENLVNNISNVSSVYCKPPETIIPQTVVDYNKEEAENAKEAEQKAELEAKTKQEADAKAKKVEDQKKLEAEEKRKEQERQTELKEKEKKEKKAKEEAKTEATHKPDKGFKGIRKPGEPAGSDLKPKGTTSGINLLDGDDEPPSKLATNGNKSQGSTTGGASGGTGNLIDFDEDNSNDNKQAGGLLDFDSKPQFLQVPFESVLTSNNAGTKGKKGITLAARFVRESGKLVLNLKFTNASDTVVKDFDSQLKPNCFGLKLEKLPPISLSPGESTEVKVTVLNTAQADSNPPPIPLLFVAGLKSSLDVFYFNTPCMFHTLLTEDGALDSKEFKKLWKETEGSDLVQEFPSINPKFKNAEKLKELFQANNMYFLTSRVNELSQTVAYFTAKSINGAYFLLEVNVPSSKNPNGCVLTVRTLQKNLAQFLIQAVTFILSNTN